MLKTEKKHAILEKIRNFWENSEKFRKFWKNSDNFGKRSEVFGEYMTNYARQIIIWTKIVIQAELFPKNY